MAFLLSNDLSVAIPPGVRDTIRTRREFVVDQAGTIESCGRKVGCLTLDEMLWLISQLLCGKPLSGPQGLCEPIDSEWSYRVVPVDSTHWNIEHARDGRFSGPLSENEVLWWFAAKLHSGNPPSNRQLMTYEEHAEAKPWIRRTENLKKILHLGQFVR